MTSDPEISKSPPTPLCQRGEQLFPPLAKGDQGGFAVVIVEVEIQPKQALLLQSLLLGEDGLGTIRCFDPERKKQQIWTVQAMLSEVYDWLDSLPASLQLQISGEWRYDVQTD